MLNKSVVKYLINFELFAKRFSDYSGNIQNIEGILKTYNLPIIPGVLSKNTNFQKSLINFFPDDFSEAYKLSYTEAFQKCDKQLISGNIEIELLKAYAKPSIRLVSSQSEIPNLIKYCRENSMELLFSPFTFHQKRDKSLNYSNMILEFESFSSSNNDDVFIYIAHDIPAIFTLWIAELLGDHSAVGKMLGYPSCCIDFYVKNIELASKLYSGDFSILSFSSRKLLRVYANFPIWTNNLIRFFENSLISHFPCSYNCPKTVALAKKYRKVLAKSTIIDVEGIIESMKTLILYSQQEGVLRFMDFYIKDKTITYNPCEIKTTNEESALYKKIRSGNKITFDQNEKKIRIYNNHKQIFTLLDKVFIANFQ